MANRSRAAVPALYEGWVIANHILVSFHVAFISSVLVLPAGAVPRGEVLRFIFLSPETIVSALFMGLTFHAGIAVHEMGHLLAAVRLNAVPEAIRAPAVRALSGPLAGRLRYLARTALRIPFGFAPGVRREGLNYYPDAPYNLAVAAAGPRASRNAALGALPVAAALLAAGLLLDAPAALYPGRLALGLGIVALLDFLLADPGKFAEFRTRERRARDQAASVAGDETGWLARAPEVRRQLAGSRLQTATHARLGPVSAPWPFRNCGMGGRHTEREYPESNLSMQEAMFVILRARDYTDSQELTVRLQTRLKEIIEKTEGCRVMGIGLEGGLAPFVDKGPFPLPEVRLWTLMAQAIAECGCRGGVDVAIALDPAMSELELAYRKEFNRPDAVGQYLFWRDKAKVVLDRDAVLALYERALREWQLPICSIEDGFAEDDPEGWRVLRERLGDRILVIGDDLVTTNDRTIAEAAGRGLINAALIKANQIGTLSETLLAMLVAVAKGLELVVSHRSKSPNDDMEAHVALAANALGLKAGGGANTERLVKYQAVTERMLDVAAGDPPAALAPGEKAVVRRLLAEEEPTNAGIPTVGASVELMLPTAGVSLRFKGATPLGTSAGTGEAIHLVDSAIERAEHREVVERFPDLFRDLEPGVVAFAKGVDAARVRAAAHPALTALYERAQRYEGKGCRAAVANVRQVIAPYFEGRDAAGLSLRDVDRALLGLEWRAAVRRGKSPADAPPEARVRVMQRKQNLGMNAMLAVSLALARGVAGIRGKALWELLREEMFALADAAAAHAGVRVAGTHWEDYAAALREVDAVCERRGTPLWGVLREISGLYAGDPEGAPAPEPPPAPRLPAAAPAGGGGAAPTPGVPIAPRDRLEPAHEAAVAALSLDLRRAAMAGRDGAATRDALRRYLSVKGTVARAAGRFGIVNNRVFRDGDRLLAPYVVGETLLLHAVGPEGVRPLPAPRLPPGTIYTDALLFRLAGFAGEPVDLESALYLFDVGAIGTLRIGRLQDIADILAAVNVETNRNAAVYRLRFLVARLSHVAIQEFLGTKNLQPEVAQLTAELIRFLNGRFGSRMRLLARLLVRTLPGLIGKPNVIDRVWNDTIQLAEVHVRGSAVANELRRSCHHALGGRTLRLARAWLEFLESGDGRRLERLGRPPGPADEEARGSEKARLVLGRVAGDLECLLGSAEIVGRIREWREGWAEALLRCDFGRTVPDVLRTLGSDGLRAGNRWVANHDLSILARKAEEVAEPAAAAAAFRAALEEFRACGPGSPGFDADRAEAAARGATDRFLASLRTEHQDGLFGSLDRVIAGWERGEWFETVTRTRELRRVVDAAFERGGFPEARYRLCHLDCLLEELGYLAARHLATDWAEGRVDLERCLDVIRLSIENLGLDGLSSRELHDLGAMLGDPARTREERRNVLRAIGRLYHKVHQRVTAPFAKMQGPLGLDADGIRAVLATLQRTMHDLNTMVHFADLAAAESADGAAAAATPSHRAGDGLDGIVHLSHREEVAGLVAGEGPSLKDLYGSKGSGLLYISHLRIPTRDGFLLPTTVGRSGLRARDPGRLDEAVARHLRILEEDLAARSGPSGKVRRFGDAAAPLLLAVRGGSVFSMPGMLATVVFTGFTDAVAETLARDDPWCAYDSYRRFLYSYSRVVWGLDLEDLDLVEEAKRRHGVPVKRDLPWEAMREIVQGCCAALRDRGLARELDAALADPAHQLHEALRGLYASWEAPSARRYRELTGICDSWSTGAIVQEMAFGNRRGPAVGPGLDETEASLTGVIPRTIATELGVRAFSGDFKFCAAGDDLVGGVTASTSFRPVEELHVLMPMLEARLKHIVAKLRRFMGTDQEVEFTVERGVLSILQTRTAETAVQGPPSRFRDPGEPATRGIGVCGGAFRGVVAFDEEDRVRLAADVRGRADADGVLMLLENPSPDEIPVLLSAGGLLSARGGSTSHAAVSVAGIEDRPFSAVMSASGLRVDGRKKEASILDASGTERHRIASGEVLSIHGATGEVFVGAREVERAG